MKGKLTSLFLIIVLTLAMGMTSVFAIDYNYLEDPQTVEEAKFAHQQVYEEDIQVKSGDTIMPDSTKITTGMRAVRTDGTTAYEYVILGDINGDGKVSAMDMSLLLNTYAKLRTLEGAQLKAADIDINGDLSARDIAQLSMQLVQLEVRNKGTRIIPLISDSIKITSSTNTVATSVNVTVTWPTLTSGVTTYVKEISIDGGDTFTTYTDARPATINLTNNARIVARISDDMGNLLKEAYYTVNNIDNVAPDAFTATATATSSVVSVGAVTRDTAIGADGETITDGIAGIKEYQYKLNDGEWQDESDFTGLTADTEYTVTAKAIDYAGNETVSTSATVTTLPIYAAKDYVIFECTPSLPDFANGDDGVLVVIKSSNSIVAKGFTYEYQINGTDGEWTAGNKLQVHENCTIYVRVKNEEGLYVQGEDSYAICYITNIDSLKPLEFTPTWTRSEDGTTITINASTVDAPATETSASTGEIEYMYKITNGKDYEKEDTQYSNSETKGRINYEDATSITAETYTFTVIPTDEYVIQVWAYDKVNNRREASAISTVDPENYVFEDGALGTDTINLSDIATTVNGGKATYMNPVVPVGFKAVQTDGATWKGVTPAGFNDGLVIEDELGNQFVWVPVEIEKGETAIQAIDKLMYSGRTYGIGGYSSVTIYNIWEKYIDGEDVPEGISTVAGNKAEYVEGKYLYRQEVVDQIELYQGFYVARYEAGYANGNLASKEGIMPMSGFSYNDSKKYADTMYNTSYVTSGLITGTQYDILSHWINDRHDWTADTKLKVTYGNRYASTLTFSGKYQLPGGIIGEIISDVQEGTNVTKRKNTMMLFETGISDNYKLNNIYDLYGNVAEYTSERIIGYVMENVGGRWSLNSYLGHTARGYSYKNSGQVNLSARQMIGVQDKITNEIGFRVMLFIKGSKAIENTILDHNTTIDGRLASYRNPVVPAGFMAVNTTAAKWGDGTKAPDDWDKGLVIQDVNGNQFVWVPAKEIGYQKWTQGSGAGLAYSRITGTSDLPTGITNENTQIGTYGGFYVARYETSVSGGVAQIKKGAMPITNINYTEATNLLGTISTNERIKLGIITGTQWDTIAKWIANERGESLVLENSANMGNYSGRIGQTGQEPNGRIITKNIYDLAGNAWELTSENYTTDANSKKIYRGGSATSESTTAMAYRGTIDATKSDTGTSFRMALYVSGGVSGIAQLPVREPSKLETFYAGWQEACSHDPYTGYRENDEVRIEVQNAGYTRGWIEFDNNGKVIGRYIKATILSQTGTGNVQYKIGESGTWQTVASGTEVKITKSANAIYEAQGTSKQPETRIYARLSETSTNVVEINVDWMDYQQPTITSSVTTEENYIKITGVVSDNIDYGMDNHLLYIWFYELDDKGAIVERDRWFEIVENGKEFTSWVPKTSLKPNTTYQIRLWTEDSAHNGLTKTTVKKYNTASDINEFTPKVELRDNKIYINAVTVSDSEIERYAFIINSDVKYIGSDSNFVFDGVKPNQTYEIYVRAIDKKGNTRTSNKVQIATIEQFTEGVYVSAPVRRISAPTDVKAQWDEFFVKNNKRFIVQIKNPSTLELVKQSFTLPGYYDTEWRVTFNYLRRHTITNMEGSGTKADPYVSDGEIICLIQRIK